MTTPVHDLIVTVDGTDVGYYVYTKAETPIEIDLSQPELPSTTVIPENPGQDGSYYSVRDQNQPAILYTNWSNGAGQKTYEGDDTLSSRFHSSSYIDTQNKGELRLARSVSLADDTEVEGITLNALGKVWMTFAPDVTADPRDQLRYWSGSAWVPVPITDADPTTGIACLATDGDYIYAAFGSTSGVYRVKDTDSDGVFSDESLASWAGGADADGMEAMVYSGGYMYGAKATAVGYFDATPTWQQINPTALSVSLTTFGLATAKNWVYWGTTADEVTRLYRCQFDGTDEWFEDVCSFPTGFIGTCMASYLGNVYVGGYYECATSSVGQGAVYLVTDGTPVLLTTIGDNPDYSSVPSSTDNDNRVWAMEPSAKDLYILTTRRVLRWDLDDGGYVHVCDVPQGTTSSFAWATTGDLDYTAAAVPDSGTWTASGTGTPTVTDGVLKIAVTAGNKYTYTATPAGGDALSNTTGTTMEVTVADEGYYEDAGMFGFDDGTYKVKVRLKCDVSPKTGFRRLSVALGEYSDGAWDYSDAHYFSTSTARTLRLICTGEWAALYEGGDTLLATVTSLEASSGTNDVFFQGGWDTGGTSYSYIEFDSVYISNDGAFSPGSEYSSSTMGGLAVRDSKLYVGINSIGYVITDSTYETSGWLRQSESTSRSGSVAKRYHQIRISHDPLRTGEDIACDWYIDGVFHGGGEGTTTDTVTTFDVDESGGSIAPIVTLTSDGTSTPIIRSVVVLFEFAKSAMHTYILDCRKGTESGRWSVDPETAIEHLISAGRYGGTFETHTDSAFKGVVQKLKYLKAQRSTRGGLEGIVQIVIREL